METGVHVPIGKYLVALAVDDAAAGDANILRVPRAQEKTAVPAVDGLFPRRGGEGLDFVFV